VDEIGRALFSREIGVHVRKAGRILRDAGAGDERDDYYKCGQRKYSGTVQSPCKAKLTLSTCKHRRKPDVSDRHTYRDP